MTAIVVSVVVVVLWDSRVVVGGLALSDAMNDAVKHAEVPPFGGGQVFTQLVLRLRLWNVVARKGNRLGALAAVLVITILRGRGRRGSVVA